MAISWKEVGWLDRCRSDWWLSKAVAVASALAMLATTASADEANKTPITLNMVWRAEIAPGDYMDTASRAEYDMYSSNAGLAYYLPATNRGGYPSIYRHRRNSDGQTFPSNFTPIAGATNEGRLGYGFAASDDVPGGLTPLTRLSNPSTIDRLLGLPGEVMPGYETQSMNGYGWSRNLTNNENLINLSAGGVAITSNLNTGGALWSWTHNGKQYVNKRDYGRQIQSAYVSQNDQFPNGSGGYRIINPTEAGTRYSDWAIPAGRRQGSPLISASTVGNTQRTRSAPLDWDPSLFGGDEDHPVYFNGAVLGKNITLDYMGRGALAEYQTVLQPAYTSKTSAIEVPTGYLNGDFNRYYTFDAGKPSSQRLTEVDPPYGTESPYRVQFTPESGYGGVILSTSDQQHAMGIYGVTVANGGSIDYFTLWDFTNLGGVDSTSGGTSKFSAAYGPDGAFGRNGPATLEAGYQYTFTTWLMSGTLDEVQTHMNWLKSNNLRGQITVADLSGDYNGNGTVDAADYVVWRNTLGQQAVGFAADGNGNSEIDAGDLAVWRANFGLSRSGAGSSVAYAVVPEPTTMFLLLFAVISLLARKGRIT